MNNFFAVKVKYVKQLDNGALKRVTEQHLFAAMTHTDAEARAHEELGQKIRGEFEVVGINPAKIHDIFTYEDTDVFYKCKVKYEKFGHVTETTKSVTQSMLVSAENVKQAYERMQESLSGLMVDFEIPSIVVSPIVEIFPYNEELDKELSRRPIEEVEENFIDPKHLMELHPEITEDEAVSLMNFSFSKTIKDKTCYGDGSTIFPQWKAQS